MRQALLYLTFAAALSSCSSSCSEYSLNRRSTAVLDGGEYICKGLVDGYSVIVEGQRKHADVRVQLADPDNITEGRSNDPRRNGVRNMKIEGMVGLDDAVNLVYRCQLALGHVPLPSHVH